MKKSNLNNPTNFYHKSADALIAKRVPEIEVDIETFASDLAHQARPSETDTAVLFMPKIKSFYEVLLESVFKLIGAFALLNQSGTSISDAFEREKKALKKKQAKLNEKARILRKDIKGLTDISHIINKWRYKWRLILIALSVAGQLIILDLKQKRVQLEIKFQKLRRLLNLGNYLVETACLKKSFSLIG